VEFDNTTQSNIGDSTNSRMNAAAVRLARNSTVNREPKPPVAESAEAVEEIILDSEPVTLNYDDVAGSGGWGTSTFGSPYQGSTRYITVPTGGLDKYAAWVVDLPRAGRWAIDGYMRPEQGGNVATGVRYRFVDGTGTVRNATATQVTGSGGFTIDADGVPDSEAYRFNKGRVYVTIHGNTTPGQIVFADALRFRLVGAEVTNWLFY
jgi:hypothetical protein